MSRRGDLHRRGFLARSAATLAALVPDELAAREQSVSLVCDDADPLTGALPVRLAAQALEEVLTAAGKTVRHRRTVAEVPAGEFCLVAMGASMATGLVALPEAPEALALLGASLSGRPAILAVGTDARGLAYALRELADRLRHGEGILKPVVERPANPVRSVMRQFTCETYDKPWFNDRAMWPRYLSMLASQRFNRLHLAFGLGYDQLKNVADSYFLFLYPFLLAVSGYDVRATNLPDAERDANLAMLRFIGEQTVAAGLDFQLGIWMHGYQWQDSPRARNGIEGLTPQTHAAYCRDALTALLAAVPTISSVALRIHGESGVAEGSYDFWKTVFDGVARAGRRVEIDLHAKGTDAQMIANAVATGQPVNLSPKFSAEHQGLPYHQAAIRELELPVEGRVGRGLMTLSEGARVFTRYGYADLMRDDRAYTVRHRVFCGTQRLLASGSPVHAAAYGRAFGFCGSTGGDLMEPLTYRGRRGSASADRRSGYADARLESRWDWEKYADWYRCWGRALYDPQADAAVYRRGFGPDTKSLALRDALDPASRILPLITTAHLPSAACDAYWPEIYWNQPLAAEPAPNPYGDTPSPKTFAHASPLDPQLFLSVDACAAELLGARSGRYSPLDVAHWLDDFATRAEQGLARAGKPASIDDYRLAVDVEIQSRLGRFFAAKFRSGVLYALHARTSDRRALTEALRFYRQARAQWQAIVDRAAGVYGGDLSMTDRFSGRGTWRDRLPLIDADIAALEQALASRSVVANSSAAAAVAEVLRGGPRRNLACTHTPPRGFRAGEAVALAITPARKPAMAQLFYRHVDQSQRYERIEMAAQGTVFVASIPAAYTISPFPLQYYFALLETPGQASLHPGFNADLSNQPYFVLRRY